jgi:hypothetical protein
MSVTIARQLKEPVSNSSAGQDRLLQCYVSKVSKDRNGLYWPNLPRMIDGDVSKPWKMRRAKAGLTHT